MMIIPFTVGAVAVPSSPQDSAAKVGQDTLGRDISEDSKFLENDDWMGRIMSLITDVAKEYTAPLRAFTLILGVIIITSLIPMFIGDRDAEFSEFIQKSVGVGVCVLSFGGLIGFLKESTALFETVKNFIWGLTPIITGITISTGRPLTAASHHLLLTLSSGLMAQICTQILIPLVYFTLGLDVCGIFYRDGIGKVNYGVRSAATKILMILTGIFVGIMTIQTVLTGAKDGLTLRAGKMLAGNFIPVIGGALSDATSTVFTSLKLVKTTVGIGAIVSISLTFLPVLIKSIMWVLCFWCAGICADFLGSSAISKIFTDIMNTVKFMISIIFFFFILTIVSFTIAVLVGGVT